MNVIYCGTCNEAIWGKSLSQQSSTTTDLSRFLLSYLLFKISGGNTQDLVSMKPSVPIPGVKAQIPSANKLGCSPCCIPRS